jgi:hypothetical protein
MSQISHLIANELITEIFFGPPKLRENLTVLLHNSPELMLLSIRKLDKITLSDLHHKRMDTKNIHLLP